MKNSNRSVRSMLRWPTASAIFAMAAVLVFAQSALQYDIVQDQYGSIIGQLDGNTSGGISSISASPTPADTIHVRIRPYTTPPPGVKLSAQAPSPTASPTIVTIQVSTNLPVISCVSGNVYNKSTGLCSDGKPPYKVVPVGSVSDPAAKTPTLTCAAPKVPTFSAATKTWVCQVPPGYKVNVL